MGVGEKMNRILEKASLIGEGFLVGAYCQIAAPKIVFDFPITDIHINVKEIRRFNDGFEIVLNEGNCSPDHFIRINTSNDVSRMCRMEPNWFTAPHQGSAGSVIALLGIPGFIVSFIPMFTLWAGSTSIAKHHGMNRRIFKAWRQLRKQLNEKDAAHLKQAFQEAAQGRFFDHNQNASEEETV